MHSQNQRYVFLILCRALPTIELMQLIPIAFWFCRSAWKRQHVTIASDNRFAVFSVLLNITIGTVTSYFTTDSDLNYSMMVHSKVGSHLIVFKARISLATIFITAGYAWNFKSHQCVVASDSMYRLIRNQKNSPASPQSSNSESTFGDS